MSFSFSEEQTTKFTQHFGETLYQKIYEYLNFYSKQWALDIISFVEYYSVNCIFICHSKQYGPAILKICNDTKAFLSETECLTLYNGSRFCKLYHADIERGVLLEEYIQPGTQLRAEKSFEKRLSVFSNLYRGLHIEPKTPEIYETYQGWVSRITEYMRLQKKHHELYRYMAVANDICCELCTVYHRKMLLHGDLHHDNILLGNNYYRIIDPKGVIGDPIFDVPRFILNELTDAHKLTYDSFYNHIDKVIRYLEKSLTLPYDILKKCFFIEITMANCWCVESHLPINFDEVKYAYTMMTTHD